MQRFIGLLEVLIVWARTPSSAPLLNLCRHGASPVRWSGWLRSNTCHLERSEEPHRVTCREPAWIVSTKIRT